MAGEKSEAPTPKKIKDARKKGNVARSDEVVSIGVLLIAVVGMRWLGPALWTNLQVFLHEGLGQASHEELTPQAASMMARRIFQQALLTLLPMLGLLGLSAVVLNIVQTGPLLSGHSLKPQFSRVNPGAGAKRIISMDGLVKLAKSLSKFAIVGIVVYLTMKAQFAEIVGLQQFSVGEGTARLGKMGYDIAMYSTAALFVMALLDLVWQRRKHIKQLMMTKQELKQEMKESDGDPMVRAAIRRRRQQLMNRMIAAVKTSDVVITNPTHFAVALKYDPVTMQAPMVVAKGQDHLAFRIRDVAMKAGVPVLEEPPLARSLHKSVPIGQYIPAHLFHAVAEVMAWVYALRSKKPLSRRPAPARGNA